MKLAETTELISHASNTSACIYSADLIYVIFNYNYKSADLVSFIFFTQTKILKKIYFTKDELCN